MTDGPRITTTKGADLGKQDVQTGDHDHEQTGAEVTPTPDSTSSSPQPWDTYSGPVWSAAEAARRCGVSRTTLTRRLTAGDIPGAVKTSDGWRIPAQGLALAGLAGRTPPDPQPEEPEQDAEHPDASSSAVEVAELRAQLAVERVKREGAEKLAEERADYIRDLRSALRAIAPPPAEDSADDSGDNGHQDTPTPSPTRETASQDAASAVEEHPTAPAPRRGVLSRLWGALTEG